MAFCSALSQFCLPNSSNVATEQVRAQGSKCGAWETRTKSLGTRIFWCLSVPLCASPLPSWKRASAYHDGCWGWVAPVQGQGDREGQAVLGSAVWEVKVLPHPLPGGSRGMVMGGVGGGLSAETPVLGSCQALQGLTWTPCRLVIFISIPCLPPQAQLQRRNGASNKSCWGFWLQGCWRSLPCTLLPRICSGAVPSASAAPENSCPFQSPSWSPIRWAPGIVPTPVISI